MASRPHTPEPILSVDHVPDEGAITIGLLGPIVMASDGRDVTLPGGRVIELLARLAVSAGRPVPPDVLVDDLWEGDEPANPANALQAVVARLRRALERAGVPGSTLTTVNGGYRLDGVSTDLDRVEALISAASDTTPVTRVELLSDALALWRGHPLADVRYREWAQPHVRRAEALVWRVREDRIEARLELGDTDDVIADLQTAVAEDPLRERSWALLMLALYRAGRQGDALASFQAARSTLRDRLGVDPGPVLVEMEAAILRHDPGLRAEVADRRPRTNLSTPITRLVGRAAELSAVSDLVGTHRFVVIVGAGGVGKTRLAVEVAGHLRDTSLVDADIWFIDLASVTSHDDIDETIATTLRVQDTGATSNVRELILSTLATRSALLVLDNCEHLVEPVSDLARGLLGACPHLTLLATSREVLPVTGAVTWPLGPMEYDDAVQLFVERAADAAPDRPISGADLEIAGAICRRLDRLPLAIELAAARVRVLSVSEIHDRLDDRFELLARGSRSALGRQQTLRAVIDWSYDLLFSDERRVFERLSVFLGDFDLRAAEAVATSSGSRPSEVVTILSRLVEKSLVTARSDGRRSRFRLLESLAEYGRTRLDQNGDLESALDAHAAHAVAATARSSDALRGQKQLEFLGDVRDSRADLLAAVERLQRTDSAGALELAGNLGWTWWVSGRVRDGMNVLERALATAPAGVDPDLHAWAAAWFAYLSFLVGDTSAQERAQRAAALLDTVSTPSERSAYTASLLSEIHAVGGAPELGAQLASTAVDHAHRAGDRGPHLDYLQAREALHRGDWSGAERSFSAAAAGLAAVDEHVIRALALASLGELVERRGDHDASIRYARAAVECVRATGFPTATASLTARHGMALLAAGRLDEAAAEFEASLDAARDVGFPPTVFASLGGLAAVAALRGDLDTAESCANEALAVATKVGLWTHVVNAHCVLVGCAIERGRLDDADRHAEAAGAAAALLGDPRHSARARLARARTMAASSSSEARARAGEELREVADSWERFGVAPSAIERAEFADAERRSASRS